MERSAESVYRVDHKYKEGRRALDSRMNCIFCKIVKGDIPSFKLIETDTVFSFLDINPLSRGHALVIPKHHCEKFHQLPDAHMVDLLATAKKIAVAERLEDYNLLQNNGRIANQQVDHVHFHIINKPNAEEGLKIGWPSQPTNMDSLKEYHTMIKERL